MKHRRAGSQGLHAFPVPAGATLNGWPGGRNDSLLSPSVDKIPSAEHAMALLQLLTQFPRGQNRLEDDSCPMLTIFAGDSTDRMPREFSDAMQAEMLTGLAKASAHSRVSRIHKGALLCPRGNRATGPDVWPGCLDGSHIAVALSTPDAVDVTELLASR